ncbi:MAG: hypothetical protein IKE34_09220 [Paenibacillus sp.]|uniref:LiaF transmembrane domain-containing protein n=1 Tax=Paenibacillus aquistagni TaxID=1852522 RepID=A0A1X7LTC7_9BACL|nr:hypothetical protein [Paenibacillus aquistagni]MBR2569351.1 hypothetical protein [Paenibacillus sp.]NMM51830.1 hypothetical protein [Paenibacillus aquistagni]SMG57156.1 hypothetical protein SAMN06295960_4360 [Paenibacillus aquistagni]
MQRNNVMALVLIAFGALILLGKLAPFLGGLFGYLIPIALIALGYYGIKAGNSFFGWVFLIIGAIGLIGKFSWLIGIIFAGALIFWGVSMLKGPQKRSPF